MATVLIDIEKVAGDLASLVDRAHAGEEIILCKGGAPYASLAPVRDGVPVPRPGRRKLGFLKGELPPDEVFFEPLMSDAELDGWLNAPVLPEGGPD
jgi:antitoxin (DNA-binding transcriptional repressor) of toxin-antitoxin stability system